MDTTLTLGEATYQLRFKMGVFEHLKELTGMDGITFVQSAGNDMVFSCYAMLTAACKCYNDKHGGTQEPTIQDVKNEADMDTFTDLIGLYTKFMNPKGEQQAEVASPSPSPRFKNAPTGD